MWHWLPNRAAANDPRWVEMARAADLIYFSGGNPLLSLPAPFGWLRPSGQRCTIGGTVARLMPQLGSAILCWRQPHRPEPLGFKIIPAFGLVTDLLRLAPLRSAPVKRI